MRGNIMDKGLILLVEDNPDDEMLALRAFKKNGIDNKVLVLRNGADAIDFLFCQGTFSDRNQRDLPAVVLLDLKLPKKDGIEVLKEIRDNPVTALLPVVILTSSNTEQDLIASYKCGANSYIRKPVDFEQFMEAVRQMGIYWLFLNERPKDPS